MDLRAFSRRRSKEPMGRRGWCERSLAAGRCQPPQSSSGYGAGCRPASPFQRRLGVLGACGRRWAGLWVMVTVDTGSVDMGAFLCFQGGKGKCSTPSVGEPPVLRPISSQLISIGILGIISPAPALSCAEPGFWGDHGGDFGSCKGATAGAQGSAGGLCSAAGALVGAEPLWGAFPASVGPAAEVPLQVPPLLPPPEFAEAREHRGCERGCWDPCSVAGQSSF